MQTLVSESGVQDCTYSFSKVEAGPAYKLSIGILPQIIQDLYFQCLHAGYLE